MTHAELMRRVTKPRFLRLLNQLNASTVDYWASGGTLLGAIRHQGIIPWDSDIDIAFKYSDREAAYKAITASGEFFIWQYDIKKFASLKKAQAYKDAMKRYANRIKDEPINPRANICICSTEDDGTVCDMELHHHLPLREITKRHFINHAIALFLKRVRIYSFRESYWWKNKDTYDLSNGLLAYGVQYHQTLKQGRFNIPYMMAFPLRAVPFYDSTINVFNDAETYLKIKYGDACLTHRAAVDPSNYDSKFGAAVEPVTDFSPL